MKINLVLLVLLLFLLPACGTPVDGGVLFRTADENLSVKFLVPGMTAPSVAVDEPEVVPEEEVGETEPDPTPQPPCDLIKGNISTRTGKKIAHAPGDPNYEQVKIDEAAGERFFCSMDEAIEAGWRPVKK